MTLTSTAIAVPTAHHLSCFTASLACYLDHGYRDPLDRIARSVQLTVQWRTDDALAAVHHRTPLGDLADGRRLSYRGASTRTDLVAELAQQTPILVLGYSAAFGWSIGGPGHNAPHFLLVDRHEAGRWHVIDAFSALLPDGWQDPFSGWVSSDDLVAAMTRPGQEAAEHLLRCRYALGRPLSMPAGTYLWLCPEWPPGEEAVHGRSTSGHGYDRPDSGSGRDDRHTSPPWTTSTVDSLGLLGDYFADFGAHPQRTRFIDDVWAAAQHHTFRYAHLLHTAGSASTGGRLAADERAMVLDAHGAWSGLAMALRFAADSAARGRPRAALVRTTFERLAFVEGRADAVATAHGYGPAPTEWRLPPMHSQADTDRN